MATYTSQYPGQNLSFPIPDVNETFLTIKPEEIALQPFIFQRTPEGSVKFDLKALGEQVTGKRVGQPGVMVSDVVQAGLQAFQQQTGLDINNLKQYNPSDVSSTIGLGGAFAPIETFKSNGYSAPAATAPITANQPTVPTGELPFQTYQRITGKTWTGGTSPEVTALLKQYNITAPAGSAEANLALQKALLGTKTPTVNAASTPSAYTQGGATSTTPSNNPTIASPTALYDNAQISALETKIGDLSAKIAAGLSTGGATEILTGLFEKFGIGEETKLVNDYNKQVLEAQQRLRKIPEDIRATTQDVGVTQAQLDRLIVQETQKPMETLRDLMELKGAAQDRINQALKFVGLFGDAAMQDRAARIEAMKFDLETNKDFLKRLDEKQKDFLNLALDNQKEVYRLVEDMAKNGAPEAARADALRLTRNEIVTKYGNYLVKPDTSPTVIGSKDTGYFQYDATTNTWKSVKSEGGGTIGGGGTTLSADWFKQNYAPEQLKQSAIDYYLALPSEQLTKILDDEGISGFFTSRKTEVGKYVDKVGIDGYLQSVLASINLWRQAGKTDAEILEQMLKAK